MANAPDTVAPLHQHLTILGDRDPHIARAIAEAGMPLPRRTDPGFSALVRIVLGQQVSVAAAAGIWKKLEKACGRKVTPRRILKLGEAGLRACGLSNQKARYALGIAEAVVAKRLDFTALDAADDDTVRATLTTLKGVGLWTADNYLLFAMGRADVWPVADLGLQHGVRVLHGRRQKPTAKAMLAIGEAWRPYRSGAAILLWHYYGAVRLKSARKPR